MNSALYSWERAYTIVPELSEADDGMPQSDECKPMVVIHLTGLHGWWC
ncbi:hypothetical protein WKK05_11400 [Nostoc sp. UHCC 0302]